MLHVVYRATLTSVILAALSLGLLPSSPAQAQPKTIALKYVTLRSNKAAVDTTNFAFGLFRLEARVDNNDYEVFGNLEDDLRAGLASIEISDGSGNFDAYTIALTNCIDIPAGILCRDHATHTRALFIRLHQVPLLYRMLVRQKGIATPPLGVTAPSGPVQVTLHQRAGIDRPDPNGISRCRVMNNQHYLFCRESY